MTFSADSALEQQARQLVQLAARFLRQAQIQAERVPTELQDMLRAHGLALRHLHAMIPLAVEGPMAVGALAERIALAPATTSQLVSELRAAGLIRRDIDTLDRRRARISLRNHLRSSITALAEGRLRPFRAALRELSTIERARFLQGWQILVGLMEQDAAAFPTFESDEGSA